MKRESSLIPLFVLLLGAYVFFVTSNAAAAPDTSAAAPNDAGKVSDPLPGAPTSGPLAATGVPDIAPAGGSGGASIDISTLGAKPGADAAQALTKAWEQACASTSATKIVVPKGNYTLGSVDLVGPCKAPITIEIAGNFQAPKDTSSFPKPEPTWVRFQKVGSLTITGLEGGAVFDGNGAHAWKDKKCDKDGMCEILPYNFRFFYVNNSVVEGITSVDSRMFHFNLINVYNFTVQKVKITAPEDSLNTDGIHLGRSTGIKILDTSIMTGDDCISLGDGTKNLTVQNVNCGPGHGISIGSLGKYDNEEPVENINIKNCSFKSTSNGVRIKTWLNSKPCAVNEVHFEDITVDNVTYPILIDQAYCIVAKCDASVPSNVKISNIYFKNIKGTATDPSLMRMVCSSGFPCENVHIEDIDLKYVGTLPGKAVSECCNVKPITAGTINPPACAEATSEQAAGNHITLGRTDTAKS